MFLYHKTLESTDNVIQAVSGSFSAPKKSEAILLKSTSIELITIDEQSLKPITLIKKQLFTHIKKISTFRFSAHKKDSLIVTSDSGKLVVLEVDIKIKAFKIIHEISYSKSGSRAVFPSEYLACDPKGRAVMIAAFEKTKYVFCFNNDINTNNSNISNNNTCSISSPIEASSPNTITFDLISIDNGYNNPLFIALECKVDFSNEKNTIYSGHISKVVSIYEMDLGLNQVVKKFEFETDASAMKLISVNYNNSINSNIVGVCICCEGFVIFKDLSKVIDNNYINNNNINDENANKISSNCNDSFVCFYPNRNEAKYKKLIITNHLVFKVEKEILLLLQTDLGDLLKLKINSSVNDISNTEINGITIEYFDTIPSCNALCVMRNGIIFAGFESSKNNLYNIILNAEEVPEVPEQNTISSLSIAISNSTLKYKEIINSYFESAQDNKPLNNSKLNQLFQQNIKYYNPRVLKNLEKLDEGLQSLGCIKDILVNKNTNNNNQHNAIFSVNGKCSRSTLKILEKKINCEEKVFKKLLKKPLAIWSLPLLYSSEFHQILIVSFIDETIVYKIEKRIVEYNNSGFDVKKPTLHSDILINSSFIQIIPNGIIHICSDNNNTNISNANPIQYKKVLYSVSSLILCASSNGLQIALGLKNKEIIYFELDKINNKLKQVEKKAYDFEILCINIGDIPTNRDKAKFLVVGCSDKYVRILSLEIQQCLTKISMQEQPSLPYSVLLTLNNNNANDKSNNINDISFYDETNYSLFIGNTNNTFTKAQIENISGNFSEVQVTALDTINTNNNNKISVYKLNNQAVIISSKTKKLICYYHLNKYYESDLNFSFNIGFLSEIKNENFFWSGIIASDDCLRLLIIDNYQLGKIYSISKEVKLRYTPRKMLYNNDHECLIILESDQNILPEKLKNEFKNKLLLRLNSKINTSTLNNPNNTNNKDNKDNSTNKDNTTNNNNNNNNSNTNLSLKEENTSNQLLIKNNEYLQLKEYDIGVPLNINDYCHHSSLDLTNSSFLDQTISRSTLKFKNFSWAGCIRVLNSKNNYYQTELLEFEGNEAALTMCCLSFAGMEETFVVVSMVKNYNPTPKSFKSSILSVFCLKENNILEFLHKTYIDDIAFSLCEFHGKLLVGVGSSICLYDLGKKQLLKKYESKKLDSDIVKVEVSGQRVFAGTINESVVVYRFEPTDQSLTLLVDDFETRWISTFTTLDYDTVCLGDKFENFSVLRVNQINEEEVYLNAKIKQDTSKGALEKFSNINNFHVGELITSLLKTSLINNKDNNESNTNVNTQVILYSTSIGSLGVFSPFKSKEEVEFFTHLEMYMRLEYENVTGRDHKAYRSLFSPVKAVIDGDLISEFKSLSEEKKKSIANEMNYEVRDINKRIDIIEGRII